MPQLGLVLQAVSAVATVASMGQQQKASRAQAQQQSVKAAFERRQAVRQTQIQRSQMLASGTAMGGTGGSALAGGMASLGSQLGGNLGYGTQMSGISRNINMYNANASMLQGVAGFTGGLAGYFPAQQPTPELPQSSFR
jgi:uncharacterized protein YcfJ